MPSPTRRIDAVLFDFGGVIVDSPFDAFSALERRAGASAGAVREINTRNPDANAWARIERGEIGVDEFARLFEIEAGEAGHTLPGRDVIDTVYSTAPGRDAARPTMVRELERCAARGIRLGLITNNIRPLRDIPEAAWLFDIFDAVVESCVVGMRKPEPGIYRRTLTELGVEAAHVVMLDDLGINLKPARSLGMTTIKVTDPDLAVADLDALLGEQGGGRVDL